jgi:hypothetical protein
MLYPVELRALTTRRITLAGDRMQTRKIDRAQEAVNPTDRFASNVGARAPERQSPRREPGATIWAVQDSNL